MSAAPEASLLVLVELNGHPEHLDELGDLVRNTLIPATRGYDGCERLSLHVNEDDPAQFLVLQRWTSRDRFERYLQWRQDRGDLPRLGELLSSPPLFRYFDDLAA
jgi:quinol monooxygenase YgiN